MKKEIKQLQKEEAKIRERINVIEQEEVDRVQIPRLKKMIGQCFAYRNNSYSCPETQADKWDVFRKIIDWVETKERGFHFIIEEFSIDRDGKITWEINEHCPYTNKAWWGKNPFSEYVEITEKEYNAEKVKMVEEMGSQKKMRKVLNSDYD